MIGIHINKGNYKTLHESLEHESKRWKVAQIITHGPQSMKINKIDSKQIKQIVKECNIQLWVHSSYLSVPWKGKISAINHIHEQAKVAHECGATGLVVHLPREPFECVMEWMPSINNNNIPIILEMPSAKPEKSYYESPEKINKLIECLKQIKPKLNFGICIDTSHIWAANTSTRTYQEASNFLKKLKHIQYISLIHLNGSNIPLGGGRDVHIIPGANDDVIWGNIAYEDSGLRAFVEFSKYYNIPMVMEINRGTAEEIDTIHKLLVQ